MTSDEASEEFHRIRRNETGVFAFVGKKFGRWWRFTAVDHAREGEDFPDVAVYRMFGFHIQNMFGMVSATVGLWRWVAVLDVGKNELG